jgi:hypothetical protein
MNNKLTPDELFSGKKPTVSHLKIFGCQAYHWIPDNKRKKLDPKSKLGIFVGYSFHRKAYRIFDAETGDIIESRDIKFLEDKKGKELLNQTDLKNEDYILLNLEDHLEQDFQSENDENPEDQVEAQTEQENTNPEQIPTTPDEEEHQIQADPEDIPQVESRRRHPPYFYYEPSNDFDSDDELEDIPTSQLDDSALRCIANYKIPTTYKEAIEFPEKEKWIQAMNKEIKSLQDHRTWDIMPKPPNVKPIKSKWVYAIKHDPATSTMRYKARLVAAGYSQRFNVDYKETFSPVMKSDSLRGLLIYAVQNNYSIHQFDIETAYLHGRLDETIYMLQPEGFTHEQNSKEQFVCKLNQAIYGLKQSGRVWYQTFSNFLLKSGLTKFKSDHCIFRYKRKNSELLLGLYVDDLLIIASDRDIVDDLINTIGKQFKIKESPNTKNFLGLEIQKEQDKIIVKQEDYISELLAKYKMQDCKAKAIPLDPNTKFEHFNDSPKCDPAKYQEIIGSLIYLSTKTRPDISYALTLLSKFNKDPRVMHMNALKDILRYLKGTKSQELCFKKNQIDLKAYSDASWRTTPEKSMSGYFIFLGNNLISWSSKQQETTSLSTCDAELQALGHCVKKAIWIEFLIEELFNIHDFKPILLCDNKSAISLTKSGYTSNRSNHLIRLISFLNEKTQDSFLIDFIPSEENLADVLTKALAKQKFQNCLKDFLTPI